MKKQNTSALHSPDVAGEESRNRHPLLFEFAFDTAAPQRMEEMPREVVAQTMGHAPNAAAEKHYINRPLELLAVWHGKYETWIPEQAGNQFGVAGQSPGLRVVKAWLPL